MNNCNAHNLHGLSVMYPTGLTDLKGFETKISQVITNHSKNKKTHSEKSDHAPLITQFTINSDILSCFDLFNKNPTKTQSLKHDSPLIVLTANANAVHCFVLEV